MGVVDSAGARATLALDVGAAWNRRLYPDWVHTPRPRRRDGSPRCTVRGGSLADARCL